MAVGGILARDSGAPLMTGVVVGMAVGFLPPFLLFAIVALMEAWCPQRPSCVCGECNSEEYKYLGPMHRAEDDAYYYECPHCEREYRSQGQKYDLKTANGYTPYMAKSKWHKWKRST